MFSNSLRLGLRAEPALDFGRARLYITAMSSEAASESDTGPTGVTLRLGARKKDAGHRAALARVKDWTRARFRLSDDDVVMVAEVECALPGCPPLETVLAFWTDDGQRRHYKFFKPVEQVVEDDLPPSWMKNALIVPEGMGCDCC
ncbi:MAG: nitrate reductase molybdenum cofactor assembly chaperone [Hyphomicrobiales bacterium]|nr:nitrate reductase molybdenum cofactor assembly chaperone [Hyphomicrobiales bacterium]